MLVNIILYLLQLIQQLYQQKKIGKLDTVIYPADSEVYTIIKSCPPRV